MISVVVTARNNNHGGNMVSRYSTSVQMLAQQAERHEIPIELVVVEWNPPDWSKSIAEVLKWPVEPSLLSVRVITVPSDVHDTFKHSEKLVTYQMIAKNVGIRRANYKWILATNPDLIFSDEVFVHLKELEDPKGLYRVFRHDIDERIVPAQTIDEALAFCKERVTLVHDGVALANLHTHACGDFTLMHRDAWFDLGGYAEFHLWSIHIDSLFLGMAAIAGYKEVVWEDARAYHIYHDRSWAVNPELLEEFPHLALPEVAALCRTAQKAGVGIKLGSEDWGLADMDFEEQVVC